MKKLFAIMVMCIAFTSCQSNKSADISIGDNTFIHDNKIYKIIDNELTEIGDLSSNVGKKVYVSKPAQHDLGQASLGYIKNGAYATARIVYRGNYLYYELTIQGLNDLKDGRYAYGMFNMKFMDEYGFILASINISSVEMEGVVDDDNKVSEFRYDGKVEMSPEINAAITKFSVGSSVSKR